MSTTGARLASAAKTLTVMERARLVIRARIADEALAPDLAKVVRPEDPEVVRIVEAVIDANNAHYYGCGGQLEWLTNEETQLGWLESLDALLDRDARLREALSAASWTVREGPAPGPSRRAREVVLPPLPTPGLGLTRSLPRVWGDAVLQTTDPPPPKDAECLRDALAEALRGAVELRWREHLAQRAVLDELSACLGERLVLPELETLLVAIEAKLLELYEVLCRRGERFELPGRDGEKLRLFRTFVRWEDLRSPDAGGSPAVSTWVPEHLQEQLAALEARLVDELRCAETTS